jgi:hypothetical protein
VINLSHQSGCIYFDTGALRDFWRPLRSSTQSGPGFAWAEWSLPAGVFVFLWAWRTLRQRRTASTGLVMADLPVDDGWGRPLESGSPSTARLVSRRIWSLSKSGTSAYAEVHAHPLGHQLSVHMGSSLLFTSVHLTREGAEREAREVRQGALAEGWTDPSNPQPDKLKLVPVASARSED